MVGLKLAVMALTQLFEPAVLRQLAMVLALVAAKPASAADLAGQATVIDGDTIEIHDTRIRFFGIDAPKSRQTCEAAGKVYRCGQQAAFALADHIGRHTVNCTSKGDPDRYGRMMPFAIQTVRISARGL
jgi:endonuclease YncB( thermonuclease family)